MLLVDDRVGSRDLLPGLCQMGLEAELCRLPFADVAFMGRGAEGAPVNIGIELKNVQDLCSSLRTGRLSGHQNPGLVSSYDYRWLVVEGLYSQDCQGALTVPRRGQFVRARGQMTLSEVEGRLLTLEMMTNLRVRHTPNRASTLQWLRCLYRWWVDSDLSSHTSHLTAHEPPRPLGMTDKQALFTKLPGLGNRMARHAKTHFKTILRAVNAGAAEWAEVQGPTGKRLGHKAAANIVKFVVEE